MHLSELLGLPSLDHFFERYFLQVPIAIPGGCAPLAKTFGWSTLAEFLNSGTLDVLVTRNGGPTGEPAPENIASAWKLLDKGCAIRLRHAERHSGQLHDVATAFHEIFGGPIDCHVYCTGADAVGLHWHYDAEDVFVLQMEGNKDWQLRKNTVNPWPVVDRMPEDMQFERERTAAMECKLAAGDWLYIPGGYWHATRATEKSLSLSVGVLSATALDLLDFLRAELAEDLRWRQRLPVGPVTEFLSEADLLQSLSRDLSERLAREGMLARFVDRRRRDSKPISPADAPPSP
jgi:50S ribosomal protein L16 3-hydroxylase